MKPSSYNKHSALEDKYGTIYLFGSYGYIDVIDDVAVAHIETPRLRLRTPDFSDLTWPNEPQEVEVTKAGLHGMMVHLGIPYLASAQKRSAAYKRHQERTNKIKGLQAADPILSALPPKAGV